MSTSGGVHVVFTSKAMMPEDVGDAPGEGR